MIARAGVGLLLSVAIAALAWRRGSLSASGAGAAVVVGTIIWIAGAAWFAALAVFFATSTLLGRVRAARKAAIKREFEKGDTRDAWQVLANGGVAAACALGMAVRPDARWLYGFAAALACANGDTWATELGILSRAEPWSLVRFRRVPRGTSGAVSPLGLAATFAGASAVALVAACAAGAGERVQLGLVAVAAGTLGALTDSLLGATIQESFRCDACARACESPVHSCGRRCPRVRGVPGFGNDAVNFAATLAAALLAAAYCWKV
jgi:uncharacterized protein (TIGR00297 family)